jgi:HEAT repeat protein
MKRYIIVVAIALGIAGILLALPKPSPDDSQKSRAVAVLLRALTSADYETRNEAEAALARIGADAAPYLIAALDDRPTTLERILLRANRRFGFPRIELSSTPQLRMRAAEQLARVAPRAGETVPALVRAFRDDHSVVFNEAQRSLRKIGARAAVPELLRALSRRDPHVRRCAAEVLRDFGPEASHATPELLELLTDRVEGVRAQAAHALARVGGADAVPGLTSALDDRSPAVRAAAANALAAIGPGGKAATASLRRRLADKHPDVRVACAKAVWMIERDAVTAVPVLTAALKEPVSWEAVLVLANIGPGASNAVPALIERLKREKVPRPLRETSVAGLALGQIGGASVPALIPILAHEDPRARTSAALALGYVGAAAAPATPHLVKLLSDVDGDVRRAATLSLGTIDPSRKELVSALIAMANDEDIFLQSLAASTLERIDPEAAASVRRE